MSISGPLSTRKRYVQWTHCVESISFRCRPFALGLVLIPSVLQVGQPTVTSYSASALQGGLQNGFQSGQQGNLQGAQYQRIVKTVETSSVPGAAVYQSGPAVSEQYLVKSVQQVRTSLLGAAKRPA